MFSGLSEDEIVRIFKNKFKPMDFYKLRHIHGLENTREKIVVTIQHFMLDALLPLNTYD